ncbi:MAG TPA: hypothetical protein VFU07_04960 [Candidatus Lumbricidophila sp.]|nr:hypothetical protein [Candidatus Lumbricidophila sp.]
MDITNTTEAKRVLRKAITLAGKRAQTNEGQRYQVTARELVAYNETIRALVALVEEAWFQGHTAGMRDFHRSLMGGGPARNPYTLKTPPKE